MQESCRADGWIYQTLMADEELAAITGGRVFGYMAPGDAASPYVVFAHMGGRDVAGVGAVRIMTSSVYQIKAVASGPSMAAAQGLADRIDEVLQRASGASGGAHVLACVREQDLSYAEVDSQAGVRWNHLGGLYRITVQPL